MRSPVACIGGGAFLVLPYSLLLSLAVIAVGPVAVEGQTDAANDQLVDRLMQGRACGMTDLGEAYIEMHVSPSRS